MSGLPEIPHGDISSLDHTSFFVLAAGAVGVGALSAGVASLAALTPRWYYRERDLFVSFCADRAPGENPARAGNQVKYDRSANLSRSSEVLNIPWWWYPAFDSVAIRHFFW